MISYIGRLKFWKGLKYFFKKKFSSLRGQTFNKLCCWRESGKKFTATTRLQKLETSLKCGKYNNLILCA